MYNKTQTATAAKSSTVHRRRCKAPSRNDCYANLLWLEFFVIGSEMSNSETASERYQCYSAALGADILLNSLSFKLVASVHDVLHRTEQRWYHPHIVLPL